jgi:hypothetical protein
MVEDEPTGINTEHNSYWLLREAQVMRHEDALSQSLFSIRTRAMFENWRHITMRLPNLQRQYRGSQCCALAQSTDLPVLLLPRRQRSHNRRSLDQLACL